MVTRKIFRKLIGIALVTAFILSACNTAATTVAPAPARTVSPLPVLPSATATNVLVATETPIPTIASNPADTPTYQTQSTQGSANNPPTTPSVSDRYPLPHVTSKGFGLITTPGKVWVGSANGMVDVLDAKSGQVLQSIALFPGSGGITGQPVFDLKFDGQHVWALAGSGTRMKPDTLFAIDAASGTVLRQFDTSEWAGSLEQKLGFSPGKIWVSHQTIDTRTFEVQYNVVPWGDYYAYDGKGWMWIIRDMNEACMPILSVVNADDPSQRYEAMKGDLHMDPCDRPITLIGDRMWVAGYAHPENNPAPVLWAYPADGSKMTKETNEPLVMVPSPNKVPIALVGDQDGLWMLAGYEKWGYLYRFDPKTGALLNSLDLVGPDYKKTYTTNLALDDHDLWVGMANELLRIHLR